MGRSRERGEVSDDGWMSELLENCDLAREGGQSPVIDAELLGPGDGLKACQSDRSSQRRNGRRGATIGDDRVELLDPHYLDCDEFLERFIIVVLRVFQACTPYLGKGAAADLVTDELPATLAFPATSPCPMMGGETRHRRHVNVLSSLLLFLLTLSLLRLLFVFITTLLNEHISLCDHARRGQRRPRRRLSRLPIKMRPREGRRRRRRRRGHDPPPRDSVERERGETRRRRCNVP
jgi:hypothetical protein